jgi:hypothetical protein
MNTKYLGPSSGPMNDNDMVNRCAEKIYACFKDNSRREFVTVIIGSGASESPKTDILKNGLVSELTEDVFMANAMVHFGRRTINDCTLEESFSIYAKLNNENSIYKFLKDKDIIIRDDDIYPTKGYEFLAHLVNTGLVHNVITTNFDEEMEISFDNEIGRENYRIIKSISEFDAFNMEIEIKKEKEKKIGLGAKEESKKPVLFKVHGTISYPRTIRASIDNVKRFEKEKQKAIKWILCNTKILIIIGFGFRDIDFQHAFSEALIEKANKENTNDKILIWWIHRNKSRQEDYRKFLDSMTYRDSIRRRIEGRYLIAMKSDDFLRELAERIGKMDHNKMIPTIARHNIRNLIMSYSDSKDARKKRFYIDVLIFALTARGLFGINALKDSNRVQIFCNEFKTSMRTGSSPYDLLDDLVKGGLIERIEDRNIFYLPERNSTAKMYYTELTENIIKFFNLKKMKKVDKDNLKSQLEILDKIFDVDIIEPDASLYLMFKSPQPIKNHRIWEEKTDEFLKEAKILKIIAQTGEWITNDPGIKGNLKNIEKLELITCEKFVNAGIHSKRQNFIEEKLKSMFGDKMEIRYLPWEAISEHIKLNDKGQGMYMKRIGKSSVVAPVWLNNNSDINLLCNMFKNYWNEAKRRS